MICPKCKHQWISRAGRKPPLTPEQIQEARKMRLAGEKLTWIGYTLGASKSYISKITRDIPKHRRGTVGKPAA